MIWGEDINHIYKDTDIHLYAVYFNRLPEVFGAEINKTIRETRESKCI